MSEVKPAVVPASSLDLAQVQKPAKPTPCEAAGYKVGDKFTVTGNTQKWLRNSTVTLHEDDGTEAPLFSTCEGTHFIGLSALTKQTEGVIDHQVGDPFVVLTDLADPSYVGATVTFIEHSGKGCASFATSKGTRYYSFDQLGKQGTEAVPVPMPEPSSVTTATSLLSKAAGHMQDRVATYDSPEGETSMGKVVVAFNAVTGQQLTEAQGWLFMQMVKDVRLFARPGYHADSAEDGIAYSSLKAEAKSRE